MDILLCQTTVSKLGSSESKALKEERLSKLVEQGSSCSEHSRQADAQALLSQGTSSVIKQAARPRTGAHADVTRQ